MAQTSGSTAMLNGFEMYYETRGQGAPLLLLHGFTGTGDDWRWIFPEPPEGYRLIVPDLRGHGRSTNPPGEFTHRQSGLDVLALLDHLSLDRVSAMGMSCGAKTLLHVATRQPSRLEALVLVSATTHFPAEARALMARITPEGRSEEEWSAMRRQHVHGDEQIRALWRQGNGFKDSYDDMSFTPPHLATITPRTLIVHGDRDPFYPVRIAFEMYAAMPRAYLWIVPDGGHVPIFGERAPRFAETALSFLRGEWKTGGP
jgi:pimeloyl-ACP methyl ester carboxylesterase